MQNRRSVSFSAFRRRKQNFRFRARKTFVAQQIEINPQYTYLSMLSKIEKRIEFINCEIRILQESADKVEWCFDLLEFTRGIKFHKCRFYSTGEAKAGIKWERCFGNLEINECFLNQVIVKKHNGALLNIQHLHDVDEVEISSSNVEEVEIKNSDVGKLVLRGVKIDKLRVHQNNLTSANCEGGNSLGWILFQYNQCADAVVFSDTVFQENNNHSFHSKFEDVLAFNKCRFLAPTMSIRSSEIAFLKMKEVEAQLVRFKGFRECRSIKIENKEKKLKKLHIENCNFQDSVSFNILSGVEELRIKDCVLEKKCLIKSQSKIENFQVDSCRLGDLKANKVEFGECNFGDLNAIGNIRFREATFKKTVDFSPRKSEGDLKYSPPEATQREEEQQGDICRAIFKEIVDFSKAVFQDHVDFSETYFDGRCKFENVEFKKQVSFRNAVFAEADMRNATFHANPDFTDALFRQELQLQHAKFIAQDPEDRLIHFDEMRIEGELDLSLAEFAAKDKMENVPCFLGATINTINGISERFYPILKETKDLVLQARQKGKLYTKIDREKIYDLLSREARMLENHCNQKNEFDKADKLYVEAMKFRRNGSNPSNFLLDRASCLFTGYGTNHFKALYFALVPLLIMFVAAKLNKLAFIDSVKVALNTFLLESPAVDNIASWFYIPVSIALILEFIALNFFIVILARKMLKS